MPNDSPVYEHHSAIYNGNSGSIIIIIMALLLHLLSIKGNLIKVGCVCEFGSAVTSVP